MRIGIIGTAGRRNDAHRITSSLYKKVFADSLSKLNNLVTDDEETILVSGGAAVCDHIACSHFLAGNADQLWLFLPAEFKDGKFVENGSKSAGSIANFYHQKFSAIMGGNTLNGIKTVIERGAKVFVNKAGFKARNAQIARTVDYLIAYTFGSGEEPADGGTKNTWDLCEVGKIHVPLNQFETDCEN